MDNQNRNEDENQEELRQENELKKLKLRAEFGAKFMDDDKENSDIPAEVESQFLDYVQKFEESASKKGVKKVKAILGNPKFKKLEDLDEATLSQELDKVMEFMALHNIQLDVIYEVDKSEIYRFIIEELLEEDMNVVDIPGMNTCFIYEEFHPNHAEDLKRESEEFLKKLIKQDFEFINFHCADRLIYDQKEIPLDQFIEKAIELLEAQNEIILPEVEVKNVEIEKDKAKVSCVIQFENVSENQANRQQKLEAEVFHYFEYGFWNLNQVKIPDLGFL
ncbi:hypothetical protein QYS49_34640 [Marivirga salinae]|uniref:Uncharacterized protein n=1 Tax=Marivirga salinarum TaxID=3059078 RepID=A0AA51RF53_9BACT|nr:hypothetical protein [Marivirga sp. BDSF4-3]WMN12795.1 hypothetical protein QYS49_34640 [Marivirga sp. BDSF4-3]